MRIEEVYLENFKSFRRARVPFFNGLTGITGSNGSGKSNLADAILFVLGPRSSRVIRAGKLPDLIYDGSNHGRQANYCKVSLIFDNSDNRLPINGKKIRVTRVVKLSLTDPEKYYSYFYLNGKSISLTDLESLLARAKVYGDGYNIVQQGDVNRLAQITNVERRKILDEIAGIAKFDEDIERAERKRLSVEENLGGIKLIMGEVKRRLRELHRDRDAALEYRKLKHKLKQKKFRLLCKKKQGLEDELTRINQDIDGYEKERLKNVQAKEELREEYGEATRKLERLENELAKRTSKDAEEVKASLENLRIEIATCRERINHYKDQTRKVNFGIKEKKEALKSRGKEIDKLKRGNKKIQDRWSAKRKELHAAEEEYRKLKQVLASSDTESAKVEEELFLLEKIYGKNVDKLKKLKLEGDVLKGQIARKKQELANAEEELVIIRNTVKDLKMEGKNLGNTITESSSKIKEKRKFLRAKEGERDKISEELKELAKVVNDLRNRYSRALAEKKVAKEWERGYTRAVRAVLEARDKGELSGIHGTIAELCEVPKRYEIALAVAAGARMQSVVVDKDDDAAKAIRYLRRKKIGRCVFLPLNKLRERKPRGKALLAVNDPASMGFAMELIKFDKHKHQRAFAYVFGDTIVMKDLYSARKWMPGVRVVTLKGELIEPSGAMVGGAPPKLPAFGSREDETAKLGAELRKARKLEDKLSTELIDIKKVMDEESRKLRELLITKEESERRLPPMQEKIERYGRKIKEKEKSRSKIVRVLSKERNAEEKLSAELEKTNNKLNVVEKEREEKRNKLFKLAKKELSAKLKKQEETIVGIKEEHRDLSKGLEIGKTNLKLIRGKKNELANELNSLKEEKATYRREREKLEEEENHKEQELAAMIKVDEKLSRQLQELNSQHEIMRNKKMEIEKKIDKVDTAIEAHEHLIDDLSRKIPLIEEQVANVIGELELYDLKEKLVSELSDQLKEDIASLTREIENLEPVNMKALEEYEEEEERRKKFVDDYTKLEVQKKALIKLARELERGKKEKLKEVYTAVNKNFRRIYKELSGGNEGELKLENPRKPFESGLEIQVIEDNRKVRLNSLSGAQKSLTALALIFAIQEYQPSPFYILDEIDMYLDAMNAELVAEKLKRSSRKAQFIVVSLRQVTLKKADHLYGVMRKNSVSRLIGGVNLDQMELA